MYLVASWQLSKTPATDIRIRIYIVFCASHTIYALTADRGPRDGEPNDADLRFADQDLIPADRGPPFTD